MSRDTIEAFCIALIFLIVIIFGTYFSRFMPLD